MSQNKSIYDRLNLLDVDKNTIDAANEKEQIADAIGELDDELFSIVHDIEIAMLNPTTSPQVISLETVRQKLDKIRKELY